MDWNNATKDITMPAKHVMVNIKLKCFILFWFKGLFILFMLQYTKQYLPQLFPLYSMFGVFTILKPVKSQPAILQH